MDILAYGEDALTLWAISQKLSSILNTLADHSDPNKCQLLFRPSFGRKGGEHRPEFGEFDFIILAEHRLYLGESKWQRSSENILDGVLALHSVQLLRHWLFKFYVQEWAFGPYTDWTEFEAKATPKLQRMGIAKPIARSGSLLTTNLQTVLGIIRKHYLLMPEVHNVLLFLHNGPSANNLPDKAGHDFKVVPLDYAEAAIENFIRLSV